MKEVKRSLKDENKSFQKLCEVISLIKTPREAQEFITDLCTPAEIQAMADRWLVVKPLKDGIAYRKINEETGVSATTIGRVARILNYGTGGYNKLFERLAKHDTNTKT